MSQHFHNFTSEAMRALRDELAAGHQQRIELIDRTRSHTKALLETFRVNRSEAESTRLQQAASAADDRTLFVKDLRSGIHSLLGRFDLGRQEMVADLHEMASELQSVRDTWNKRPRTQHHRTVETQPARGTSSKKPHAKRRG